MPDFFALFCLFFEKLSVLVVVVVCVGVGEWVGVQQEIKPRASFILGKHSTNWVTFSGLTVIFQYYLPILIHLTSGKKEVFKLSGIEANVSLFSMRVDNSMAVNRSILQNHCSRFPPRACGFYPHLHR